MVFVKVRETYDLKTTVNKMTVIAIHTPKSEIIKRNWAGLLMNCKFYRPVKADVGIACASTLPLDPQGVGLTEGDVAPEDAFNPILYKACTNESFSLMEARILHLATAQVADVEGNQSKVEVDDATPFENDFNVYYGLLNHGGFATRMPQDGLVIKGLRPMVHEALFSFGGGHPGGAVNPGYGIGIEVSPDGAHSTITPLTMRGSAKPMPRMPTTMFPGSGTAIDVVPGFPNTNGNSETEVPWLRTLVGCIIIPPARLHELFFRMTVSWTLEFSEIRSIAEIGGWAALNSYGENTHFVNYDFSNSKTLNTDQSLASSSVEMKKVME